MVLAHACRIMGCRWTLRGLDARRGGDPEYDLHRPQGVQVAGVMEAAPQPNTFLEFRACISLLITSCRAVTVRLHHYVRDAFLDTVRFLL